MAFHGGLEPYDYHEGLHPGQEWTYASKNDASDDLTVPSGSDQLYDHTFEAAFEYNHDLVVTLPDDDGAQFYDGRPKTKTLFKLQPGIDLSFQMGLEVRLPGIFGVLGGLADSKYITVLPALIADDIAGAAQHQVGALEGELYANIPDGIGIGDMDANYNLPRTASHYAHWVNGAGFRIVDEVEFKSGSQTMTKMTKDTIYAISEVNGVSGYRAADLAGFYGTRDELIRASASEQALFVEIPLFTKTYLKRVQMQLGTATLTVTTPKIEDMIVVAHPAVLVTKSASAAVGVVDAWRTNAAVVSPWVPGTALDPSKDLQIVLYERVLTLPQHVNAARMKWALANTEAMLVHNLKTDSHVVDGRTLTGRNAENPVSINIREDHAIEQIIVLARLAANGKADPFNYTRLGPEAGTHGFDALGAAAVNPVEHDVRPSHSSDLDIIKSISLRGNRDYVVKDRPAKIARTIGRRWVGMPTYGDSYTYVLPFDNPSWVTSGDVSAWNDKHTGAMNPAAIRDFVLELKFDGNMGTVDNPVEIIVLLKYIMSVKYESQTLTPTFAQDHDFIENVTYS